MRENIIKTLSYAQVFNFPLEFEEIYQRLIQKKTTRETLEKHLSKLKVKSYKGYYYLDNKNQVTTRLKNKKYSTSKTTSAYKIAKILKIFPSIQAVLVTGTIAAKNPKKDDDIDFLIITKHNSLWITRLFVNIVLDLLRLRRSVKSINHKDKACLNLWLTTKSMSLPKNRQNLYTAYEISLAIPLWDRSDTYNNFLFRNKWILRFLPNKTIHPKSYSKKTTSTLSYLDFIAFKFQFWYMKSKQTNEQISRDSAFFHPRDTREEIENKYQSLLQKYKEKL